MKDWKKGKFAQGRAEVARYWLTLVMGLVVLAGVAGCGGGTPIADELPELPNLEGRPEGLVRRLTGAHEKVLAENRAGPALAELAELLHGNGWLLEAWACYELLIDAEPNNARWQHLLASIVASYGQLEEAIPLWERVIQLAPEYAAAHVRLGDLLVKLNRFEEAGEVYEAMLKRHPGNAHGLMGLGRVAMAGERWEDAVTHLEAARANSQDRIGVDLLATAYEKMGRKDRADYLFRTVSWGGFADIPDPWMWDALERGFDPSQLGNNGGMVAFAGDLVRGTRMVERANRLNPSDVMLRFQLGGLYLQQGQIAKAKQAFTECTQIDPRLSDGWIQLVEIAKQEGSPLDARVALDMGLRHCPESPSLLIEKGTLMMGMKLFDEAEKLFREAVRNRPNEALAYVHLAQVMFATDRLDEGAEILRRSLDAEPGHLVALSSMAFIAVTQGSEEEAEHWLEQLYGQPRMAPSTIQDLEGRFREKYGRPSRVSSRK